MNLTTATPVEIDTELAALHHAVQANADRRRRAVEALHSVAKSKTYVPAQWRVKAHYTYSLTEAEVTVAVTAALAAAKANTYDGPMSTYTLIYGGVEASLAAVPACDAEQDRLHAEIAVRNAEYNRRPWSRFFLVTSSDGHIHSSMSCSTCRPTTAYGWLPEMSGLTEEAAMTALTELGPGPSALCSVCFPNAPVAADAKRTTVTKAKAAKLAA